MRQVFSPRPFIGLNEPITSALCLLSGTSGTSISTISADEWHHTPLQRAVSPVTLDVPGPPLVCSVPGHPWCPRSPLAISADDWHHGPLQRAMSPVTLDVPGHPLCAVSPVPPCRSVNPQPRVAALCRPGATALCWLKEATHQRAVSPELRSTSIYRPQRADNFCSLPSLQHLKHSNFCDLD